MFEDFENDAQKRDVGEEEDLEQIMDYNQDEFERDLKSQIVFAMQGMGGVRVVDEAEMTAYIKGKHCEESIKDLVKLIRSDSVVNPKSRLTLAQFNIF